MRDAGSQEFLATCRAPVIEVVTKIDLAVRPTARPPDRPGVSVVTGEGLADLRRKLAEEAYGRLLALGDVEPVVTRARHRGALERALAEVDAFHVARDDGVDAAATAGSEPCLLTLRIGAMFSVPRCREAPRVTRQIGSAICHRWSGGDSRVRI